MPSFSEETIRLRARTDAALADARAALESTAATLAHSRAALASWREELSRDAERRAEAGDAASRRREAPPA